MSCQHIVMHRKLLSIGELSTQFISYTQSHELKTRTSWTVCQILSCIIEIDKRDPSKHFKMTVIQNVKLRIRRTISLERRRNKRRPQQKRIDKSRTRANQACRRRHLVRKPKIQHKQQRRQPYHNQKEERDTLEVMDLLNGVHAFMKVSNLILSYQVLLFWIKVYK